MSASLQVGIAFAVSIIGFLILWTKEFSKFNKLSVYIIVLIIYIVPYALGALFIGKIGFFFSAEYIIKNIFLIISGENIIIAFMLVVEIDEILEGIKNITKEFKVRIFPLIVITVIVSIFWGMKSYSCIIDENNAVKTNYIQESVQEELYWNAK